MKIDEKIKENTQTEFFGFNYDKMFKAVFVGSNETENELLCQLLNECIEEKIDAIPGFLSPELNAKSKNERYKRLDLIALAEGKRINIELNSCYDKTDRIRNINYFFAFCSQYTEAGDAYDTETLFIHVSFNYRASFKEPLIKRFQLYDKENDCVLDPRFIYYEINVEKFAKLWYDNDMKSVRENPLLTMIGIKNKEDLERYSEEMDVPKVKESVEKLKRLNGDAKFINNITPEREVILIENTKKKLAREEGEAIGIAKGKAIGETRGVAKGKAEEKLGIATNMLENNYPLEEISKMTHLSIDEIKNIKL